MESKGKIIKFFSWFSSEHKIKRWLILAILSVVSICYAISIIITTDTVDFKTIFKIVLFFVLGFAGVVVSYISMQKQTLEIMVRQTDKRDNVKSLIYNKKVYSQGPKIVVIGGGSGLNSVLRGLKKYTENITAVVTGYEGFSDISDVDEKVSISNDIKESLIALAKNEKEMEKLMNFNFSPKRSSSISFCDMYLNAMQNINYDLCEAVLKSSEVLGITGKVIPATSDNYELCADFEDGSTVRGKSQIPVFVSDHYQKIDRVFLSPSNIKASSEAISAIMEADAIVIGPGSLYTKVIPNLLVKGITKALKETKAFKVYISNIMTEPGGTYGYALSDHLKALNRHLGEATINYCIYDTGEVMPEYIRKYNQAGSELVEQDIQKAKLEGINLMKRDLATIENKRIRHNSDALADAIINLVCEDLKFKDKQNDPEYLFLEQKLKYKKLKNDNGERWVRRKPNKDGKTKFYAKYEDRMESIKESEEKAKRMIEITEKNDKMLQRVSGMRQVHKSKKTKET